MGLNHLQSLICTYSADDLRPLMFLETESFENDSKSWGLWNCGIFFIRQLSEKISMYEKYATYCWFHLCSLQFLVWTIAENWLKWMGFQMRRQWYGQLRAIWKRYLRWKHFCFNLLETKTDTYENVSPNTNCNGRGGRCGGLLGESRDCKGGGKGETVVAKRSSTKWGL